MLFNQLVHSIIICNACIWGHSGSKVLASIQLNALRFCWGWGRHVPIVGLLGESGWVPYSMMVKFNILRFWKRIMRMEGDRITKKSMYMGSIHSWRELQELGLANKTTSG